MGVVVVGGGQAAAQAILSLRQGGYKNAVALIGEEPVLPYQRPPLSKTYMEGAFEESRLFFRRDSWYGDNGVDLVLGRRATAIDRIAQTVALKGGGEIAYDRLILSTGARPQSLSVPGADLDQVHDLRTLADVKRIRPRMLEGRRIVIVGAGYIGLEAAAVARRMGLEVTVIEMAERVLARVTSPVVSDFYKGVHEAAGVRILTSAHLTSFRAKNGSLAAAVLKGGDEIEADIALVGIGVLPNEELAKEAGLHCDDGVLVDRDCRASDANIFAAGDCAKRPLVHYDRLGRLESVHNAIEQGKLAAAAIMGKPRPREDCPWFWSDQYDLKLQIAGLSQGYDDYVVRGDPQSRKFAVFYLCKDVLIAVDAVNAPAEFLASKKLIAAGARPAPERLADASLSMKDLATAPL